MKSRDNAKAGRVISDQSLIDHLSSSLFDDLGFYDNSAFLVAFSGGKDSMALLHGLAQIQKTRAITIRAAHLDHGLQIESKVWVSKCIDYCKELGINLVTAECRIDTEAGESIEASARNARYQWLESITKPGEIVLTAHHAWDQAETFLMHLFQGKDIEQLAGIRKLRRLMYGSIVQLARPMLDASWQQIDDYINTHHLAYIEDPSNKNNQFYRNFIRNEVIPSLQKNWPDVVPALKRGADACARISDKYQRELALILPFCEAAHKQSPLCLQTPLHVGAIQQNLFNIETDLSRLIRYWLHQHGYRSLSTSKLDSLTNMISDQSVEQGEVEGEHFVIRYYDNHLFLTQKIIAFARQPMSWDGSKMVIAPLGLQIEAVKNSDYGISLTVFEQRQVSLCWRYGGEHVRLPGRQHHSSLKKIMQQKRIARWQRHNIPYLCVDGEIAWVAGVGVLAPFLDLTSKDIFTPQFSRIMDRN